MPSRAATWLKHGALGLLGLLALGGGTGLLLVRRQLPDDVAAPVPGLRGEVRGGRFVAGFGGEQYALPAAVELLRRVRRTGTRAVVLVESADPLNYSGILNREERVSPMARLSWSSMASAHMP